MPLPAAQLLDPFCALKPAWAVFDPGWYLHRHAEARAVCAGQNRDAVLDYYLRVGARLGHSPNPFFDERYYLAKNPDIAELVQAGNYASGFDHYCQHGHRGVSPHFMFDDQLYENLYDDMSLENLDQHQCHGRYDHYLRSGQREKRMGQFLFDGAFYRARAIEAGVPEPEIDAAGPYAHYLARLGNGLAELPPSIYFEPAWYLDQNAAAKAAVERGVFTSAIQHYLCCDGPDFLDPVPQFSEPFYRQTYPEIAAAVESGFFRSGYQHFIQHGAFELRRPRHDIDLMYYRDINERVRNDLNTGEVRDAFAHLRLVGLKDNLPHCPPAPAPQITETGTRQQFLLRARNNLALFARKKLDFGFAGAPALTVIMVAYNKFELTMLALASLRDNFAGAIELILVDNDSTDDTMRITDYVQGATILRMASNIGFLRAANIALAKVTAPACLFINNDIELAHGAVAAALARLVSAEKIAAVGGKIIRSNGVLQEAGSIIWDEGTTTGYMRDASPLAPEANFVRDVDYCSAVFLLCRTDLLQKHGGFDEAFAPAYYEEVDLCVRFIQAGYRIVYDPAVMLHHLEFGSAVHSEASMALMRRGRRIFKRKHEAYLRTRLAPVPKNLVHARELNKQRRRILFLEDTVPLRRLGSGFVRSNDIVHAIAAAGYDVDVFPINGAPHDVMSLFGDLPETAEILHDRSILTLSRFLREREHYYDLIWICRTHNLARVLPIFREAGTDLAAQKVILDTEAVVAGREAAQAALANRKFDIAAALRREFVHAEFCNAVTAVNAQEVALLQEAGFNAQRLGTMRAPTPTPRRFAERSGLSFVGAIHQQQSPNLDSLHWLADDILPALATLMQTPPLLHVAGYVASGIELGTFKDNPFVKLHGCLGDLRQFYETCRLFVAPTRFAAGTPYKIYEAAAFGLPCVTTDLLAAQLGWADDQEVLTAPVKNAKKFAAAIARAYADEALWTRLRDMALARLRAENGEAPFHETVSALLRNVLYGTKPERFAAASRQIR